MRLTSVQFGTLVGLVSLSFFFGAMVLAFGLRLSNLPEWSPFLVPPILFVGTGLLLGSSATLEWARYVLRRAKVLRYRTAVLITILLAVAFLVSQCIAASDLIRQGVATQGNLRGSAFYFFMAIHGLHLVAGLGWLGWLWRTSGPLVTAGEHAIRQHRRTLTAAAAFWHFLGVLWLILFLFLRGWATV